MLTQIFSQQLSQPYPTQLLQVPSSKRWQQSRSLGWVCSRGGGRGLGGGNPAGRGGNGGMGGYKYCRPPKPEHSWTRPSRPRASARGRALGLAIAAPAITARELLSRNCGARSEPARRDCRENRVQNPVLLPRTPACPARAFRKIPYPSALENALAMCGGPRGFSTP